MSVIKKLKLRIRPFAKTVHFALKGIPWGKASWLARRDAPIAIDYGGAPLDHLQTYWSVAGSWQDLAVERGVCASKTLGLKFGGNPIVTAGYKTFIGLASRGWRFREQDDGSIRAEHMDLTLNICTAEECEMLKEIFLDECYSLVLPGSNWTVLDIGGNVGMAALYFAGLPWVESVVSYEPFKPTAAAFRRNLELNEKRSAKITLVNKGVGEEQARLQVDYTPELRGSMSLDGVGAWRGSNSCTSSVEVIELIAADEAAKAVCKSGEHIGLLAKIDCEGSEYGILRRLKETDALRLFSAFLIEWHGKGPADLTTTLEGAGFAVREQSLSLDINLLGLICAVKLPVNKLSSL